MHKGVAAVAVAAVVPCLAIGAAQAAGGKGVHVKNVTVRVGHHRCTKTAVNGVNIHGTVLGTTFCGHDKVFIRKPNGKTTSYVLPKADARYTEGANIASNGIFAVEGAQTKKGQSISYIVHTGGVVTPVQDPSAGPFSTSIESVNRHGAAVGQYCLDRKCDETQAFIYRHGTFKNFVLHRKGALLPSLAVITDSGVLGGSFYQQPGYSRAFVKRGHKIHVYDAPQGDHKLGDGTFLTGAGSHGVRCGIVIRRHAHPKGFIVKHNREHVVDLHPHHHRDGTNILTCNSHGEFGGVSAKPGTKYGEGFVGTVG